MGTGVTSIAEGAMFNLLGEEQERVGRVRSGIACDEEVQLSFAYHNSYVRSCYVCTKSKWSFTILSTSFIERK